MASHPVATESRNSAARRVHSGGGVARGSLMILWCAAYGGTG